ncbi:RNB domain-containing ribonuclease [Pseudoxanthomonas gei]|uniref:RNB domain-containing ribonuclease n=1 Tax=Pseudoxanthomonas gei TaxID=1383030 RepID=A0ABX0AD23_9GAMM|nr:RNB domain-containing ribonuclease [Pseudoxanthomonas gei]NDK39482.1 RNB domain-containing ribonuclease [Pseudoxanthomonas gei]
MTTTRRLHLPTQQAALASGMAGLQRELGLPSEFPPEVEQAAVVAAANPRWPDEDRTGIEFVTIDPPDAMDLDQAMFVERSGQGYRVHYAIADVAAFVAAGDAIDLEAHRRGETLYGADAKVPLHPRILSEDAASLLPDQVRPALLWTIELDASGEGVAVDVRRARIRSRAKLDYAGVQRQIDAGTAGPMWAVLREIGTLRKQREQRRGGVSLPLPEQEVRVEEGRWTLEFRARHPVEDWNEQISLLTGMAAAHLMVEHGVGLLRTLPDADPRDLARLHRTARALGVDWPQSRNYPDFIRSLDPANPRDVAMMTACTSVLRGAGYVAFDGAVPEHSQHSALAAQYTHVTAPLRRLVDRYTGETCLALCGGTPVPQWVLDALPALPATMQESARRASRYENAVLDLAEAAALASRVGEVFEGAIVEIDRKEPRQGEVMLREPAILARVDATHALPLGEQVRVRLVEADPATRRIRFELAE